MTAINSRLWRWLEGINRVLCRWLFPGKPQWLPIKHSGKAHNDHNKGPQTATGSEGDYALKALAGRKFKRKGG